MSERLQSVIEDANHVRNERNESIDALVRQMATAARETNDATSASRRMRWWRRRRIMLPLGITGALVLTGGAALIPLSIWINGTQVEPDISIPIEYTTDTGVPVACTYLIYYNFEDRDEDNDRLNAFLQSHDWSGIGQRAYKEAISDPFVPGPEGSLQNDSQQARDRVSLGRGINRALLEEIPAELQGPLSRTDSTSASTTDCEGLLH